MTSSPPDHPVASNGAGEPVNICLSPMGLSSHFMRRLESKIGTISAFVRLSDIANKKGISKLAYLRSLECSSLFLVSEDRNSLGFMPILKIIASLIPAGKRIALGHDLAAKPFGRLHSIKSAGDFALAVLDCQVSKLVCAHELDALLNAPRIIPKARVNGKIVYLHTDLWFGLKAGGSVGHVSGVVGGFINLGYDVDYHSALDFSTINPKAVIHRSAQPAAFGLPMELNHLRLHRLLRDALTGVSFEDVSFVYQRMSLLNYTGVTISRRMNRPLILEYNGSEAWVAEKWGSGRLRNHDLAIRAEEANLRHAHLVVTISDAVRDEIISRGVEPDRIVTYPNCVNPDFFNPEKHTRKSTESLREKYGIAASAIVVTFVGTFGRWHGAEKLALAVKKLADTQRRWLNDRNVVFMFVGQGATLKEVIGILSSCGLGNRYVMTGLVPQEEAPAYMAASDILVSPHVGNADGSRFFGSPTKLFEYMAMGKGILASALEQIGDVMKPALHADRLPEDDNPGTGGELCVLAGPGDVDGLTAGIKFLVENPGWRRVLGDNARREALSKYTWEKHVAKIIEGVRRVTP